MPRRPGAGRPAGSLNRLAFQSRALMDELKYNPIESLVHIAQDENMPIDLRIDAHKNLCKYYAPQLKAVDVQQNNKGNITINMINFCEQQGLQEEKRKLLSLQEETVIDVTSFDASDEDEEEEDE